MKLVDKYEVPYSIGTWIVGKEKIPIIIGGKEFGKAHLFQDLSNYTLIITGLKDVLKKNVDPVLIKEDRVSIDVIARNVSHGCIMIEGISVSKIG